MAWRGGTHGPWPWEGHSPGKQHEIEDARRLLASEEKDEVGFVGWGSVAPRVGAGEDENPSRTKKEHLHKAGEGQERAKFQEESR